MKKQSTTPFSPISKSETEKLTTVVSETIALVVTPVRIFSSAELWDIQRRGRTMMSRRSYFA
jgi:hypothetical protein